MCYQANIVFYTILNLFLPYDIILNMFETDYTRNSEYNTPS